MGIPIRIGLLSATLATVILLVQMPTATGDQSNATVVLDGAEQLVQEIGDFALQNYRNAEALVKTCDDAYNCSRRVCAPLERDFPLTCETVPTNVDCRADSNSFCTTALVSKQRSFVWWSRDADLMSQSPTCEMKSTICAQRELDAQIFLPRGQSTDFKLQSWVFFGSSTGLLRIFPGKELNETTCQSYEARERPWFAGAWAVEKELVVLLDHGPQMGQLLSLSLPGQPTFFDAGRNITLRLMNTLCSGDSISVIPFDGSGATPLEPKVNVNVIVSALDQPTLQPLRTKVEKVPTPDTSSKMAANLTAALIAGRNRFSLQTSQMKVFIIITSGDLSGTADLQPDLLNSLISVNVTVFVFRLLASSSASDSASNALKNASCHLNGWYEEAVFYPQDPLGTLNSFYSYMAKLRSIATDAKPYWLPRYLSYTSVSHIITVAFPVFNGSFLVGVAGVDIAVDNLGPISSDVTTELAKRNLISFITVLDPPRIVCNQTLLQSARASCTSATGLCTADRVENTPQAFQERVCCSNCPASESLHTSKVNVGAIVGGIVGGIIFVGFLCCGFYCTWHNRDKINVGPIPPLLHGPDKPDEML